MAAKKNFYAVAVGREPGIYTNWPDCQKQVTGFKGALFQGFETRTEAEHFMAGLSDSKTEEPKDPIASTLEDSTLALAYVDGSFNAASSQCGYGVVFFYQGEESHYYGDCSAPDLVSMRNVTGEIFASMKAMELARKANANRLIIFHDYEGIAKWPLGLWKANKEGTKQYVSFYEDLKDQIQIEFFKVDAHTGVTYNEIADSLAKKGAGQ